MLMHLKRKNKTKKLEDINKSQHSYYYYYYFKLQRVDVPSWIHINIFFFKYPKFNYLIGVSVVRD